MNLTGWCNHAVELEWQERQEAQSLPGWAVCDVLSSMLRCLSGSLGSVQLPLNHLEWEIELCVISVEMVGETMDLYDGTQWCSVNGEEEGSNNWALRYSSEQLMCFGNLPSPGHLEGPASEVGFKPAKWNPCYAQWWECGPKAADRSSRMRTNDLESAFAIRKASVTESSTVSVECPLLKPDWLVFSWLFCERNENNWLKTTRSSVFRYEWNDTGL